MSISLPALAAAASCSQTVSVCFSNTGSMTVSSMRDEKTWEAVLRWTYQRWPSELKMPSPSKSFRFSWNIGPFS